MLRLSFLALSVLVLSSTAAHAAGDGGWANFLIAPLENIQAGVGMIVSRIVGIMLMVAAIAGLVTRKLDWGWFGIILVCGMVVTFAPDIANAFFGG